MPRYRFKARTVKGRTIKGEMDARDEIELVIELKRVGLAMVSFKEYKARASFSPFDGIRAAQDITVETIQRVKGEPEEYDPHKFQRGRRHRADIRQRIAKGDTNRMPTFYYLATTDKGRRVYGEMEAKNEEDLSARLQLIELTLVNAKREVAVEGAVERVVPYRVPLKDLVILAGQLEIYFRLDMVMAEILDAVRIACGSKRLKGLLLGVRNHVAAGMGLAAAMKQYPHAFSRFFMGIIDVGEETGKFSGVLMYAHRHLQWMADFRHRLGMEFRGPVIALIFTSGLFVWLPVYAFYLIAFQTFTLSPGLHGTIARVVNPLVMEHGLAVVLIPTALWCMIRIARTQPNLALEIDGAALHVPWFGKLWKLYDTMNFAYLFGIMWEAGITAERALFKAKDVIENSVLREAVERIADDVHMGSTLSDAFAQSELFEPMVVMAFRQGETTGRFEAALDGVYYFYVRAVEDAAERFIWVGRLLLFFLAAVFLMMLAINSRMHH